MTKKKRAKRTSSRASCEDSSNVQDSVNQASASAEISNEKNEENSDTIYTSECTRHSKPKARRRLLFLCCGCCRGEVTSPRPPCTDHPDLETEKASKTLSQKTEPIKEEAKEAEIEMTRKQSLFQRFRQRLFKKKIPDEKEKNLDQSSGTLRKSEETLTKTHIVTEENSAKPQSSAENVSYEVQPKAQEHSSKTQNETLALDDELTKEVGDVSVKKLEGEANEFAEVCHEEYEKYYDETQDVSHEEDGNKNDSDNENMKETDVAPSVKVNECHSPKITQTADLSTLQDIELGACKKPSDEETENIIAKTTKETEEKIYEKNEDINIEISRKTDEALGMAANNIYSETINVELQQSDIEPSDNLPKIVIIAEDLLDGMVRDTDCYRTEREVDHLNVEIDGNSATRKIAEEPAIQAIEHIYCGNRRLEPEPSNELIKDDLPDATEILVKPPGARAKTKELPLFRETETIHSKARMGTEVPIRKEAKTISSNTTKYLDDNSVEETNDIHPALSQPGKVHKDVENMYKIIREGEEMTSYEEAQVCHLEKMIKAKAHMYQETKDTHVTIKEPTKLSGHQMKDINYKTAKKTYELSVDDIQDIHCETKTEEELPLCMENIPYETVQDLKNYSPADKAAGFTQTIMGTDLDSGEKAEELQFEADNEATVPFVEKIEKNASKTTDAAKAELSQDSTVIFFRTPKEEKRNRNKKIDTDSEVEEILAQLVEMISFEKTEERNTSSDESRTISSEVDFIGGEHLEKESDNIVDIKRPPGEFSRNVTESSSSESIKLAAELVNDGIRDILCEVSVGVKRQASGDIEDLAAEAIMHIKESNILLLEPPKEFEATLIEDICHESAQESQGLSDKGIKCILSEITNESEKALAEQTKTICVLPEDEISIERTEAIISSYSDTGKEQSDNEVDNIHSSEKGRSVAKQGIRGKLIVPEKTNQTIAVLTEMGQNFASETVMEVEENFSDMAKTKQSEISKVLKDFLSEKDQVISSEEPAKTETLVYADEVSVESLGETDIQSNVIEAALDVSLREMAESFNTLTITKVEKPHCKEIRNIDFEERNGTKDYIADKPRDKHEVRNTAERTPGELIESYAVAIKQRAPVNDDTNLIHSDRKAKECFREDDMVLAVEKECIDNSKTEDLTSDIAETSMSDSINDTHVNHYDITKGLREQLNNKCIDYSYTPTNLAENWLKAETLGNKHLDSKEKCLVEYAEIVTSDSAKNQSLQEYVDTPIEMINGIIQNLPLKATKGQFETEGFKKSSEKLSEEKQYLPNDERENVRPETSSTKHSGDKRNKIDNENRFVSSIQEEEVINSQMAGEISNVKKVNFSPKAEKDVGIPVYENVEYIKDSSNQLSEKMANEVIFGAVEVVEVSSGEEVEGINSMAVERANEPLGAATDDFQSDSIEEELKALNNESAVIQMKSAEDIGIFADGQVECFACAVLTVPEAKLKRPLQNIASESVDGLPGGKAQHICNDRKVLLPSYQSERMEDFYPAITDDIDDMLSSKIRNLNLEKTETEHISLSEECKYLNLDLFNENVQCSERKENKHLLNKETPEIKTLTESVRTVPLFGNAGEKYSGQSQIAEDIASSTESMGLCSDTMAANLQANENAEDLKSEIMEGERLPSIVDADRTYSWRKKEEKGHINEEAAKLKDYKHGTILNHSDCKYMTTPAITGNTMNEETARRKSYTKNTTEEKGNKKAEMDLVECGKSLAKKSERGRFEVEHIAVELLAMGIPGEDIDKIQSEHKRTKYHTEHEVSVEIHSEECIQGEKFSSKHYIDSDIVEKEKDYLDFINKEADSERINILELHSKEPAEEVLPQSSIIKGAEVCVVEKNIMIPTDVRKAEEQHLLENLEDFHSDKVEESLNKKIKDINSANNETLSGEVKSVTLQPMSEGNESSSEGKKEMYSEIKKAKKPLQELKDILIEMKAAADDIIRDTAGILYSETTEMNQKTLSENDDGPQFPSDILAQLTDTTKGIKFEITKLDMKSTDEILRKEDAETRSINGADGNLRVKYNEEYDQALAGRQRRDSVDAMCENEPVDDEDLQWMHMQSLLKTRRENRLLPLKSPKKQSDIPEESNSEKDPTLTIKQGKSGEVACDPTCYQAQSIFDKAKDRPLDSHIENEIQFSEQQQINTIRHSFIQADNQNQETEKLEVCNDDQFLSHFENKTGATAENDSKNDGKQEEMRISGDELAPADKNHISSEKDTGHSPHFSKEINSFKIDQNNFTKNTDPLMKNACHLENQNEAVEVKQYRGSDICASVDHKQLDMEVTTEGNNRSAERQETQNEIIQQIKDNKMKYQGSDETNSTSTEKQHEMTDVKLKGKSVAVKEVHEQDEVHESVKTKENTKIPAPKYPLIRTIAGGVNISNPKISLKDISAKKKQEQSDLTTAARNKSSVLKELLEKVPRKGSFDQKQNAIKSDKDKIHPKCQESETREEDAEIYDLHPGEVVKLITKKRAEIERERNSTIKTEQQLHLLAEQEMDRRLENIKELIQGEGRESYLELVKLGIKPILRKRASEKKKIPLYDKVNCSETDIIKIVMCMFNGTYKGKQYRRWEERQKAKEEEARKKVKQERLSNIFDKFFDDEDDLGLLEEDEIMEEKKRNDARKKQKQKAAEIEAMAAAENTAQERLTSLFGKYLNDDDDKDLMPLSDEDDLPQDKKPPIPEELSIEEILEIYWPYDENRDRIIYEEDDIKKPKIDPKLQDKDFKRVIRKANKNCGNPLRAQLNKTCNAGGSDSAVTITDQGSDMKITYGETGTVPAQSTTSDQEPIQERIPSLS